MDHKKWGFGPCMTNETEYRKECTERGITAARIAKLPAFAATVVTDSLSEKTTTAVKVRPNSEWATRKPSAKKPLS